MKDPRKQSLYFPDETIEEIKAEAKRLDRPISWVMQRARDIAKSTIAKFPTAPGNQTP